MSAGSAAAARPARRCRHRALDPASPRPGALLTSFFALAFVHLLAAAAAGVWYALSGAEWLHWLALHLLLLGGVSQLVLGVAQFFACAFLATDPPPRRLVALQLLAWNGGTVLVASGVLTGTASLLDAGGLLLAVALGLFGAGLRRMQRRSLQRAPWAVRWYATSAAWLALGGLAGLLLARDTPWSQGDLLGAHLAFTLAGWIGTAIIGTLHTFFPSLTQTQLRHPRLQRATYGLWSLGVPLLAGGAAFANGPCLATGWTALLLSAALLAVNVTASLRAGPRPLGLPPRLLALAHAFLLSGLAVALAATIDAGAGAPFEGPWRPPTAALLLAGWVGLTVAGSLLHLLAVLARIRRLAPALPEPRVHRDSALTAAAGVAVVGLALSGVPRLTPLTSPASALTLIVAGVLALRIGRLAVRGLRPRSPSAMRDLSAV